MNRTLLNLTAITTLGLGILGALPASANPASAPAPKSAPQAAPMSTLDGTIGAVSKKERSISIDTKEGRRVYAVLPKTELILGGKAVALDALKVGQKVHADLKKSAKATTLVRATISE